MIKVKSGIYVLVGAAGLALLAGLLGDANVQSRAGQKSAQAENYSGVKPTGKELDDAATPVIDFDKPGGVERGEDSSRKLKNARHDKEALVVRDPHPQLGDVISEPEWQAGLSDLPADRSDVIIEGQITDAEAFLSDDKTGVYSEFTARVSKVLKVAPELPVNPGDTIVTERQGES